MLQFEIAQLGLVAFYAVGILLFVATSMGFLLKGPVRWVKVCTALLLAQFVAHRCFTSGWQSGIQLVGITGAAIFASVSMAFLTWRHPVSKVFSPATLADCPEHARSMLERWTHELEDLGFQIHADHRTVWQIKGGDRVTFIRFLVHHGEPLWVEIHALDNPKVVARMAMTDKGDGRAVMTCDRQADQELFDDPLTKIQRVASAADCTELVDAHRKLAMSSEGRYERIEDPAQTHTILYDGWIQRLLETRQVHRVGESQIALKPSSIPGLVLKTHAAWFH